jgi:Rad3-related DNA helicase
MPLIRFDLIEGRTDTEITTLLDAAHRAVLTAFAVPERDRYQVVTEHKPSRVIAQDTGLGIPRTSNLVLVSVVTRARSRASKQIFYAELCREFKEACNIEPGDVIVSFTTNSDDDWSFGHGVAQYLTGDLSA